MGKIKLANKSGLDSMIHTSTGNTLGITAKILSADRITMRPRK